ncbi:serine protease S8 [Heterobasidion irregulare TC 32-1]|uniref:Serine protease S8 n=1 Tax=Heterobasidion irregulare (strain TC 32-1) TaxID=747525 RepID=W4KP58_HETIT|nr:serine protease S8 [Heterobasidion irregulare TC 32-1]ETW87175.1 serine protease S8 [Heterobasidion irregulare TC 32-1]
MNALEPTPLGVSLGLARMEWVGGSAANTNFVYRFGSSAGAGVDTSSLIPVSIFTGHSDFGGRARWAATFGGYPNADGNGHGTHVSGTAAGSRRGVAKSANLIAVKMLSDQGSGSVSDIVSGLNFVSTSARSSGRPTIATMSLGGSASTALENAVSSPVQLVSQGIHVKVAAGNDNANADNTSPARVGVANTIGASTINDTRASFSNFGSVVDIFAPGQLQAPGLAATNRISGTSMVKCRLLEEVSRFWPHQATSHVAGLIAYLITRGGNASPAVTTSRLKGIGINSALSSIPSGTVNLPARNDV